MANFLHGPKFKDQNIVICFDPGDTTGYAILHMHRETKQIQIKELGEFSSDTRITDFFTIDEITARQTVVIFEKFHLIRVNVSTTPIEVIGAIKCITKYANICTFQQPPSARIAASKVYRDQIKIYKKHHMDALMHGLVFGIQYFGFTDEVTISHPKNVTYWT